MTLLVLIILLGYILNSHHSVIAQDINSTNTTGPEEAAKSGTVNGQPKNDSGASDLLVAIIAAFAAGAAAAIAALTNHLIQRRQEYIATSQYRMESISRSKVHYSQLVRYYGTLSSLISIAIRNGKENADLELILYYFCNIFWLHKKVFEELGDLQLDNLDAEDVLSHFSTEVAKIMYKFNEKDKAFSHDDVYRIADLIQENQDTCSGEQKEGVLPPAEFRKKLLCQENRDIKKKFEHLFLKALSQEDLEQLQTTTTYFVLNNGGKSVEVLFSIDINSSTIEKYLHHSAN